MLRTLMIQDLILVKEAHLVFSDGLTIITGETGSGKSALIEALSLILGVRCDSSKVRKGCKRAKIQASFEIEPKPSILSLFEEYGLHFPMDEELIILREIPSMGKSRALISGQLAPLSFLQKMGPMLCDFVDQLATLGLKNRGKQRDFLDLYAGVDLSPFHSLWKEEQEKERNLQELIKKQKRCDLERIEQAIAELEEHNPIENEEISLFEEYSLLANAQEIGELSHATIKLAEEGLSTCTSMESHLRDGQKLSDKFSEALEMAKTARLNLTEVCSEMTSLLGQVDSYGDQLAKLGHRLKEYERLKTSYGNNLLEARKRLEREKNELIDIEEAIASAQDGLKQARKATKRALLHIHFTRITGAKQLGDELSKRLRSLNISAAEVEIEVSKGERTQYGEDLITFFLRANRGEAISPIQESSSGGELSRLLFTLKLALRGKEGSDTLIFDEIDANVGGETATKIGQELKSLAQANQILCITHFPQVAKYGDHHLQVKKIEEEGRTICQMNFLKEEKKEKELLRMLGGVAPSR